MDETIRDEKTGRSSTGALAWRLVKTIVPWAATAAIFYLIFKKVPLSECKDAIASVNLAWWVPILAADFTAYFLADVLCHYLVFNWMAARTGFIEVLVPKGATFILNMLNFALGVGGMGYWLAKKKKIGVKTATGPVFFLFYMDLFTIFTVSLAGLALTPEIGAADFFISSPAGHAVRLVTLTFLVFMGLNVIWSVKPEARIFSWLFKGPFVTFSKLRASYIAQVLGIKLGAFTFDVLGTWLGLMAFGVEVELSRILAYLPLIYLIGALPITVMRLGTTQAAWLYFFHGLVPDGTLIAFSLLWTVSTKFLRATTGVACLHWAMDDFRRAGPDAMDSPEETREKEDGFEDS